VRCDARQGGSAKELITGVALAIQNYQCKMQNGRTADCGTFRSAATRQDHFELSNFELPLYSIT
jgi:hypothetical protein